MCYGNNNRSCGGGVFQNNQAFWIVLVIAVVLIWVHYASFCAPCCGNMCCCDSCGDQNGCMNGRGNCCC